MLRVGTKEDWTYRGFTVCHEDGKVGEMAAWAGGVCFIGVQEFAALGGPVAHHASLRVIPEGAIGVEVVLHLQITRDMVKCPNNWLPEIEAQRPFTPHSQKVFFCTDMDEDFSLHSSYEAIHMLYLIWHMLAKSTEAWSRIRGLNNREA